MHLLLNSKQILQANPDVIAKFLNSLFRINFYIKHEYQKGNKKEDELLKTLVKILDSIRNLKITVKR